MKKEPTERKPRGWGQFDALMKRLIKVPKSEPEEPKKTKQK